MQLSATHPRAVQKFLLEGYEDLMSASRMQAPHLGC